MSARRVVYPVDAIRRSKERRVRRALETLRRYARPRRARDFPHTIVFDWNGTVDARNTGVGVPLGALVALRKMGKEVVVYTSSVDGPGKSYMRETCDAYGIPYTGKARILARADMFVGDKAGDERRAGKWGAKFVWVDDFDLSKILAQKARDTERGAGEIKDANVRLKGDARLIDEVRAYNKEYGPASAADVNTELKTRGVDLEFQGKLDRIADTGVEHVAANLDRLVKEGRLKSKRTKFGTRGYEVK